MNIKEYLLVCVNEEGLEIGHAADKALRFGLHDGYPGTDRTNITDLVAEINDLIGVLELMRENGIELPKLFDRLDIETKKARVNKYMAVSKNLGTLE